MRGLVALAAALSIAIPAWAQDRPPIEPIEITARAIKSFKIGSDERNLGPLEFVGGLELSSSADDLGALSAFRFLTPGGSFVGVADTGFWFYGTIVRDGEKPVGVANFRMAQMTDAKGNPVTKKWEVDAEGLAVRGDDVYVGFERRHRIVSYRMEPGDRTVETGAVDFLVPANELRQNRGFEAIAFAAIDGPNQGAMVAVSEKSLDKAGDIFAAVLSGPNKGIFTVKRSDAFDITDSAFLPGGDLLLLERSFSMATGVGMRLRRIPGDLIRGGAKAVDGPILFHADMGYQIDNMEGMDVWKRADDATMISLISDDNHSILQRNLYLEFVLRED